MKNKYQYLLWVIISLSLNSCSESKLNIRNRPHGYNLDYWLAEKVEIKSIDNSLLYESRLDIKVYLDSAYTFKEVDGRKTLPDYYVIYNVFTKEEQSKIETIKITDPKITVYGLSLNSNEDTVKNVLLNMGFTYQEYYGMYPSYTKDNYCFSITNDLMILELIRNLDI